jgi:hypothetical protein
MRQLSRPTDEQLRRFLLGALQPEEAGLVVAWVEADPAAAEVLHGLTVRDGLADALVEAGSGNAARRGERSAGQETAVPDTMEILPPATQPVTVAGYAVVREIGRGGMGVVYEAEDPRLHRRIVLKVMRPELAGLTTYRSRFLREAQAQAAVEHDHIVAVHQVGEEDGLPFIAMPLLKGQTLADALKTGRLPLAEAVRIAREVALGLAAAHERGLVHRDIKPANIWLESPRQRVKVLDFGLARPLTPERGADLVSEPGQVMGTPPYMSPEQARGKPLDARSDLFSLGSLLYQLVTGQLPFPGPEQIQILYAVTELTPARPATLVAVPEELDALVMKLLAKAPADRPASAAAVAEELGRIERGLANARTVEQGTPEKVPARRSTRRRVLLAAAGLLVLGGLAGLAVWLGPVAPLQVDLDLTVWKKGHRQEVGRWVGTEGLLPLVPDDTVRVEVTANRPVYFYLVYLDAGGKVTPLYPWKGNWEQRQVELPRRTLNVPEVAEKAGALTAGPTGVEALVLLAREDRLPADVDFARLFTSWSAQNDVVPNDRTVFWLENGKPDTRNSLRAPWVNEVEVSDPRSVLRDLLEKQLAPLGGSTRVVAYGFRGN